MSQGNRQLALVLGATIAISSIGLYLLYELTNKNKRDAIKSLADKLGKSENLLEGLTDHELIISNDVIKNQDVDVTFRDVGGMATQLDDIIDNIILPMRHWKSLQENTQLVACPSGGRHCVN